MERLTNRILPLAGLLLPLATIGLLAVLLADPFRARRSFLIEADTLAAVITFEGGTSHWDLGEAMLCRPLERIDLRAAPGSGPCDSRRFAGSVGPVALAWNDGATVAITDRGARGLTLRITGLAGLPDGSLVVLSHERLAELGALSFAGHLVLGRSALSGESGLLLSGSYEARERPLLSSQTETVKSGVLRSGDSVRILEDGESALTYGHLTLPEDPDQRGLHLVGVSAPGRTALEVSYFGGRAPNLIRPNWVDRALTSPLLIAGLFLISAGAGQIQLLIASVARLTGAKGIAGQQAARSPARPARRPRKKGRLRRWRQ
ncbi:hypothetical protein [Pseudogemmobacter humi]|uniref:Uncharacterized protein n=1 Tax=Pseudogemmobacter humi TaxID=2483812 RepID=A0A3P5XFR9_9RHOB|nr:hypothetical protein [Pseudogemmobacter humi]VDC33594.1 hypothetical protein XINFAN_03907 [Pseudogemmobacter humi]